MRLKPAPADTLFQRSVLSDVFHDAIDDVRIPRLQLTGQEEFHDGMFHNYNSVSN
jgi:hypothetical protein